MKKQKATYLKPVVWEDCGFTCHRKYKGNPPITQIYFLIYFFFYLKKILCFAISLGLYLLICSPNFGVKKRMNGTQ